MRKNCYIVKMNTSLEGLFDELNDYGFDYECDNYGIEDGYLEITVSYYSHEIRDLENIFAPYV